MNPGDSVEMVPEGSRLIAFSNGVRIGVVEPRVAARLLKLMADGNKYAAGVTSLGDKDVRLIIRETFQDPSNYGKVSFPTAAKSTDLRPYTKGTLVREEMELEEDLEDDEEDEEIEDLDACSRRSRLPMRPSRRSRTSSTSPRLFGATPRRRAARPSGGAGASEVAFPGWLSVCTPHAPTWAAIRRCSSAWRRRPQRSSRAHRCAHGPGDVVADLAARGGWPVPLSIGNVAPSRSKRARSPGCWPRSCSDRRTSAISTRPSRACPRRRAVNQASRSRWASLRDPLRTCGRMLVADEFTWSSEGDGPARPIQRHYRRTVCRDMRGGPDARHGELDPEDVERATKVPDGGASRAWARDRFPVVDGAPDPSTSCSTCTRHASSSP